MDNRTTLVKAEGNSLAVAVDDRSLVIDELRLTTVGTDPRTVVTTPVETLYVVEPR